MDDTISFSELKRTPENIQFAQIINRYGSMVHNVCSRILGDSEKSETASLAVFFLLCENVQKLKRKVNLPAWLHRTALGIALSLKESVSPVKRSGRSKDWNRIEPWLDIEIDTLPEKQRILLVEAFLCGPAQDSGFPEDNTGISATALLSRGMETVRERFAQRGTVLSLGSLIGLVSSCANLIPLPDDFHAKASGVLLQEVIVLARDMPGAGGFWIFKKAAASAVLFCAVFLITVLTLSSGEKRVLRTDPAGDGAPHPGMKEKQPGTALNWREIGTSAFYREYRPAGSRDQTELRFGAWWSDPDYVRGWENTVRSADQVSGKPMTDFNRFMTVAVFRRVRGSGTSLSIKGVFERKGEIQVLYTVQEGGGKRLSEFQVLLEVEKRNKPVVFIENGKQAGEVLPFRRIDLPEWAESVSEQPLHVICRSIQECIAGLPLKSSGPEHAPLVPRNEWPVILKVFFRQEMVVAGYFGAVSRPAEYDITQIKIYGGKLHIWLELTLGGDGQPLFPNVLAICPRRDLAAVWYVDGQYLEETPPGSVNTGNTALPAAREPLEGIQPALVLKKGSEAGEKPADTETEIWGQASDGLQLSSRAVPLNWTGETSTVQLITKVKNVSDHQVRIAAWHLFSDGLEIMRVDGKEIRCMQFARATYKPTVMQFPVLQPGETKEFTAEGKFGPSRSEGWYSLTMGGLTGATRRWSIGKGIIKIRAVVENSENKNWLQLLTGDPVSGEIPWTGRVQSNEITITVGKE